MSIAKLPIIKITIVPCYWCGRFIILDETHRSPSGKRIPLDNHTNKTPHKCLRGVAA